MSERAIGIFDSGVGGLTVFKEVLRQLPGEEDRILPLLAALSRLRRDIETAFPHARAFLRPGFDTGEGTEA